MPRSPTVGMVPAMFQVPIRAPTASRMKTAPMAAVTPPTAASATAATVCPFLKATRLAKAALRSNATWSGPSVALTPNSEMVSASRPISTPLGSSASTMLGSRGGAVGCRRGGRVHPSPHGPHGPGRLAGDGAQRADLDAVVVLLATGPDEHADHQGGRQ